MNILTRLVYSDAAFTADGINLDPALLLGGSLNLSNDLLLTCIIGAVVIGVGQGMVVRTQATTGGTDIIVHVRFRSMRASSFPRVSSWRIAW